MQACMACQCHDVLPLAAEKPGLLNSTAVLDLGRCGVDLIHTESLHSSQCQRQGRKAKLTEVVSVSGRKLLGLW